MGLYVIQLEHLYTPPRYFAHATAWEVADIQWNPHMCRSEWVASTVRVPTNEVQSETRDLESQPPVLGIGGHGGDTTCVSYAHASTEGCGALLLHRFFIECFCAQTGDDDVAHTLYGRLGYAHPRAEPDRPGSAVQHGG